MAFSIPVKFIKMLLAVCLKTVLKKTKKSIFISQFRNVQIKIRGQYLNTTIIVRDFFQKKSLIIFFLSRKLWEGTRIYWLEVFWMSQRLLDESFQQLSTHGGAVWNDWMPENIFISEIIFRMTSSKIWSWQTKEENRGGVCFY